MSCKTLQLNKCEIKGSTFSGRKFTFQNRDISNDKFTVVGYNHYKQVSIFTIQGSIIGNSVYFSYSDLEKLQSGAYILKFWAEFKDLATELIAVENFKISTTPCDGCDSGNTEYTLDFGDEIVDYELEITGSKGAPFIYDDFTQEQINDLKKPAIDASFVALDAAESANNAADLANEKAGLANQSAINANSATTEATTATQNANEATAAANNATQQAIASTQESITATENANRAVGQANEVISSATLVTSDANTAAQNAISATEGAISASQNAITSTENSIIKTNEAIRATSEAIQATENANEATRNTVDATLNANMATQNANEATSNANEATQNTVNAIIEANTATQNANTAAQVANNAKGWTPVFQFENDGDTRQVNKLIGYVGGTGIAPTDNIGSYVKEKGYTLVKSEASNFKGSAGNLNAASDIILSGAISKLNNGMRVFNKVFQSYLEGAQTGIMSIKFPTPTTAATMFDVTLKIYGYSIGYVAEIKVTFYRISPTSINAAGLSAVINATDIFPTSVIKVGIDNNDLISINIGEPSTVWGSWTTVEVERVSTSFIGFVSDWSKGWSRNLETVVVEVPTNYKSLQNITPKVLASKLYVDNLSNLTFGQNKIIGKSIANVATTLDAELPNGGFISSYSTSLWAGSDAPAGSNYGGYIKFKSNNSPVLNNDLDFYYNNGHNSTSTHRLWFRTKNGSHGSTNWLEIATREWVTSQLGSYVTQVILNAQLANYVTLSAVQTFSKTITFLESPVVPNGTLPTHAVNLSQLTAISVEVVTVTSAIAYQISTKKNLDLIILFDGATINFPTPTTALAGNSVRVRNMAASNNTAITLNGVAKVTMASNVTWEFLCTGTSWVYRKENNLNFTL